MPKLFLVRHAEPAVADVLLGRTDPPLSEAGRREAHEKLSGLEVELVYSSPLRRCLETAAAIDAPLRVLDELAEISLGDWDGLSWGEVERLHPELAARKAADWFGVTPPHGEDWRVFVARITQAADMILRGPLPAAIIGHVAANAVIVQHLTGAGPASFNQRYCETIEL